MDRPQVNGAPLIYYKVCGTIMKSSYGYIYIFLFYFYKLIYIFSGNDLPSNEKFQMYPIDRIVPVGSNTTFCCILGESKTFGEMVYGNTVINATRLSRRSYAITVVHQKQSGSSGDNVICYGRLKSDLKGTVVFVGCKMAINHLYDCPI